MAKTQSSRGQIDTDRLSMQKENVGIMPFYHNTFFLILCLIIWKYP